MARGSEYTRLPGRGGNLYRHSLWLASDHVLSVINRGYSEDYKRFYFRDVRAIQLRRTSTYAVINAVFGAIFALFALVQALAAFVWQWSDGGQVAFAVFTFLFGMFFFLNLLFGPTCTVQIYTAVHSESMPSLHRMRTANKTIRLLQSRIETAQGTLTSDQVLQNSGALGATSTLFREQPSQPSSALDALQDDYSGNFHWSLFALLLFNALLTVAGAFYRTASFQVVNAIVYLGLGICMIGALIRQRRSRMEKGVRRLAWISAFYVWFISVLGSFVAVYILIDQGPRPGHYGFQEMVRAMMETVPADHLPLLVLTLFSATCSLVIGLAGAVLMLQYRRKEKR